MIKACYLSVKHIKEKQCRSSHLFYSRNRYQQTDATDSSTFSLALILPISNIQCANRPNSSLHKLYK